MTASQHLLAERDAFYLRALLASNDHDETYVALLERKLSQATLRPDDAIDAAVATIDSRVDFTIGGDFTEHRVLTRGDMGATDGLALPITTLRGLALLGLRENEVFPLRKPNGIIEPIRLIRVAYQPQAAQRQAPSGTIVRFQPRWMQALEGETPASVDDDPGPSAA